MSFTYQRTHKSVRVDTRPDLRSARALFDSEDEEEPEESEEQGTSPLALPYKQTSEPDPGGDPAWSLKLEMELDFTTLKKAFLERK